VEDCLAMERGMAMAVVDEFRNFMTFPDVGCMSDRLIPFSKHGKCKF
jgi:hypothetical protein